MTRIDGLHSLATSRTQTSSAAGAVDGAARGTQGPEESLGAQDRVSLSGRARLIAEAAAAVANAPESREAKVLALKAAIANGTYDASPREVAERLLATGTFGSV